jgi:ribosomal protein L7/L12
MEDLAQRIADLVARGETIAAIKRLREATGMGLAEAKAAIEAAATGVPLPASLLPSRAPTIDALPDDVRAAAVRGDRLQAIKLLRGHTGLGLKDAKDAIDRAFPVPVGKRGCLPLLLFVAGAAVVGFVWFG